MNIPIKVNRDFELAMEYLKNKYGEDFEYLNGFHESQLNFSDFIDGFIDKKVADATIDSNANASNKDVRSLLSEKGKSHDKLFSFNKIFYELKKKYGLSVARKWLEAEYDGSFYLHDSSSSSFLPYCYAFDLSRLATEGLFFLDHYNNEPPKHLTTFFDDVIEFISFMSNRSSGACGLPNVLIWSYYFYKKDCEEGYVIKDNDYYVRQCFQKFIYRLNQPFLRISQSAFVNVSIFDRPYLEAIFGGLIFPDGSFAIDCIEEIIEHQKIFMEVVSDIRNSNMFTFPVLTYSLLKRNDLNDDKVKQMIENDDYNIFLDNEFARWCSDHNSKWNDSNFYISDSVDSLSSCCRLRNDFKKLKGFINSIGGTSLSIGSVKVNTINLMRIALESNKDQDLFFSILEDRTKLCCMTLDVIRHVISRNIEKGLLPNYQEGGMDISHQYMTIGILGFYEAVRHMGFIERDEFGNVNYTDDAIKFSEKLFKVIDDVKDNFDCDYSFNIESVPGEQAAIILCQKDSNLFDLNHTYPEMFIYSNQWIPLSEKCTIHEKLRVSSILDDKCSGGSIAHINLENNFPNLDTAWNMLNKIALSGVFYFAFNTRINECSEHHGFVGTDICPVCGGKVIDTYQRIVGYLVPSRSYSKNRFKEFTTRKWFDYAEELSE